MKRPAWFTGDLACGLAHDLGSVQLSDIWGYLLYPELWISPQPFVIPLLGVLLIKPLELIR